jgi:hypothetical protein
LCRRVGFNERPGSHPASVAQTPPSRSLDVRFANSLAAKRRVYFLTHWHAENQEGERERRAAYLCFDKLTGNLAACLPEPFLRPCPMSALHPGCVKTHLTQGCAELFSIVPC